MWFLERKRMKNLILKISVLKVNYFLEFSWFKWVLRDISRAQTLKIPGERKNYKNLNFALPNFSTSPKTEKVKQTLPQIPRQAHKIEFSSLKKVFKTFPFECLVPSNFSVSLFSLLIKFHLNLNEEHQPNLVNRGKKIYSRQIRQGFGEDFLVVCRTLWLIIWI